MLTSYCNKVVSSLAVSQSLETAMHLRVDVPDFGMWFQKLSLFSMGEASESQAWEFSNGFVTTDFRGQEFGAGQSKNLYSISIKSLKLVFWTL